MDREENHMKPKQIGHTKHIIKVIFVIYLKVDHYLIWEQERTLYDKFKILLKSNELKVQKNMVLFIQKSFLQVHKMRWTWTEVRNWNDMSEDTTIFRKDSNFFPSQFTQKLNQNLLNRYNQRPVEKWPTYNLNQAL